MPGTHHPHSPSALEAQELCPGRFKMCQGLPEQQSDDADEGTMIHERVVTRSLEGLTAEQAELVVYCCEFLERFPGKWMQEQPLTLLNDDFETLTAGTADAVLKRDDGTVIVVDWKMGRKKVTDPEYNIQLQAYGCAAMQTYGAETCQVWVVQPRIKNEQCAQFTANDIQGVTERIQSIIATAHAPGLNLIPGEKQCQYCRAKAGCPAQREMVTSVVKRHASDLTDPNMLSMALDVATEAEKWARAVKHQAREMLFNGEDIPGYMLKNKSGAREVENAEEFYNAAAQVLSHAEVMKYCSFNIGKVEDAYARVAKRKAQWDFCVANGMSDNASESEFNEKVKELKATRQGDSLKNLQAKFRELTAGALARRPDSKVLTKKRGA
jgi:hypothetical protein